MDHDEKEFSCSFCGKERNLVKKLIAGPGVYICNECVDLSHEIINKTIQRDATDMAKMELGDPQELKNELDRYVVSQHSVKEILSTAAVNHTKRIMLNITNPEIDIQKSNMLMIGTTGTGKTLMAKTLANVLDVPITIVDATSITESGYVGEDADSILEKLLNAAGGDLELAQQGIVFVDEIDKKASKTNGNHAVRDVSGEGVQQSLLKLMEGNRVKVKISNKRGYEDTVDFDTTNVLFIFSGAFVGLEKIIEKRLNSGAGIGFGAKIIDKSLHDKDNILKNTTVKDLTDYGLIPEMVGRLPVLAVMDSLQIDDYVQIMRDVNNCIVDQYQALGNIDGVHLEFSEDFLREVAQRTHDMKLGGRGVRSLMDAAVTSVFYRIKDLEKNGVTAVHFNKYLEAPELVDSEGNITPDTQYKIYRGLDVIQK